MLNTNDLENKSRLNAIKHGLYATEDIFLASLKPNETAIYEEIRTALHEEYKPLTDREKHLVDRIAIHHFRLYRLYDLENRAVSQSRSTPLARYSIVHHLDRFSRYDWRIEKQLRMLHNRLCSMYINRRDFSLKFIDRND
jgi:hypothetical protein